MSLAESAELTQSRAEAEQHAADAALHVEKLSSYIISYAQGLRQEIEAHVAARQPEQARGKLAELMAITLPAGSNASGLLASLVTTVVTDVTSDIQQDSYEIEMDDGAVNRSIMSKGRYHASCCMSKGAKNFFEKELSGERLQAAKVEIRQDANGRDVAVVTGGNVVSGQETREAFETVSKFGLRSDEQKTADPMAKPPAEFSASDRDKLKFSLKRLEEVKTAKILKEYGIDPTDPKQMETVKDNPELVQRLKDVQKQFDKAREKADKAYDAEQKEKKAPPQLRVAMKQNTEQAKDDLADTIKDDVMDRGLAETAPTRRTRAPQQGAMVSSTPTPPPTPNPARNNPFADRVGGGRFA